ncbi:MAG: glycoside hydrolase family 2 TIM barrel-domain containing protein [Rikenellaceae bacterium]
MKQYIHSILSLILVVLATNSSAQQIFSAEIAPYEMRGEAEQRNRKLKEYYQDITPKKIYSTDSTVLVRQIFMLPAKWSGRVVVLHLQDVEAAYDLVINDSKVLSNEDGATPTNVNITKYLTQGVNRLDFILRDAQPSTLNSELPVSQRDQLGGSYIVAYPHTYIRDFDINLWVEDGATAATLDIAIAVKNDFSEEESVDVGFDIYDPSGKLLDYSVNPIVVQGGATDTIRFAPKVSAPVDNRWTPQSPKLYKVMIYTRRNGVVTEYIPRNVGVLNVEYRDNQLYNFGQPLTLNIENYTPLGDKEQSRKELRAIKAKGHNTIKPDYAQPLWFYELCYEEGMWVIDQININSTHSSTDKRVGGTPSNDPALLGEYLRRGKATYYRSREFRHVIAYSLGSDEGGNGYNMYKLYEWMKSVEPNRPIIYGGAQGEWNSDFIK